MWERAVKTGDHGERAQVDRVGTVRDGLPTMAGKVDFRLNWTTCVVRIKIFTSSDNRNPGHPVAARMLAMY